MPWSLEAVKYYLINSIASELRKDNSSTGIGIVVHDKHYSMQALKIEGGFKFSRIFKVIT